MDHKRSVDLTENEHRITEKMKAKLTKKYNLKDIAFSHVLRISSCFSYVLSHVLGYVSNVVHLINDMFVFKNFSCLNKK